MRFVSDNAAAAHPKVIEAIERSNRLDAPYDGDEWSSRLDGAFSDLFETEVRALWVSTGTAANCLALAALCPPHGLAASLMVSAGLVAIAALASITVPRHCRDTAETG